jgi:hypothetical protein
MCVCVCVWLFAAYVMSEAHHIYSAHFCFSYNQLSVRKQLRSSGLYSAMPQNMGRTLWRQFHSGDVQVT